MQEKKHTEETYPYQLVRTYVYRERSIDDGSHYDPNIDKTKVIKELRHNEKIVKDFLKAKKKKSSIEKMKELVGLKPRKSTTSVEENELRRRYREYSPSPIDRKQSITAQDIANRRRLSTPTSSPLTNRSSSLPPKSMKIHKVTTTNTKSSTLKRDKDKENINSQKFSWFASLDRLAKKKSKVSDRVTICRFILIILLPKCLRQFWLDVFMSGSSILLQNKKKFGYTFSNRLCSNFAWNI